MKTKDNRDNQKKKYSAPQVDRIQIDQQISLAMQSVPPVPDDETYYSPKSEKLERC